MKDEAQTRTLSGLGSSIAIRAAVLLARVTPPHVDPLQLKEKKDGFRIPVLHLL
jgi:hypothetical protein